MDILYFVHSNVRREIDVKETLARIIAKPIPNRTEYWKNQYRPTQQKVAYTYNMLNKILFKGRLVRPNIELYRQQQCWGWANLLDNHRVHMGLSNRYPCEQFFVGVLAHEMIHQWQWEVDAVKRIKQGLRTQTCHGENFQIWKDKFDSLEIPFGMYLPHYYK